LIRTVDKFEPGTPNLIGAIALAAACDFYTAHDLYAVLPSYERDLSSYLTSLLSQNKKITII
jgi:selenocysteine lyase/cysteine desulfurase